MTSTAPDVSPEEPAIVQAGEPVQRARAAEVAPERD